MMAYSSEPSVSEPSVAMRLRNAGATPPEKPGSMLTSIPIFKIFVQVYSRQSPVHIQPGIMA
jgi:hypothetical protein